MSDVKSITIPLTAITISPLHYRTVWDAPGQTLAQLGESMANGGQLEEIRVRITEPGKYELIDGARRFKAAGLAGLKTLRAIVEDNVGDDELLRRQLVHASGIALHPMDEAQILDAMARQCGMALAEIVEVTGLAEDVVRRRLKLCGLGAKGRALYASGALTDAVAFAASRIGSPKLQDELLKQITSADQYGRAVNEYQALALLRQCATRHLGLAQWPLEAAYAGKIACAGCPERTLAQLPLFGDLYKPEDGDRPSKKEPDDYCANPACWAVKLDEACTQAAAKAKADGLIVLGKPEREKLFVSYDPGDGALREVKRHAVSYADADRKPDPHEAGPKKSPRALGVPLRAFIVDPDGYPRYLVDVKAAEGAKRSAERAQKRAAPAPASAADKREQAKRKAERAKELEADAVERAIAAAVEPAARKATDARVIEVVARLFMNSDQYRADELAEKRATTPEALIKQLDAKGKPEDRRALLTLLMFDDAIEHNYTRDPRRKLIADHAKLLGVDVAAVTKAAIKSHAAAIAIEKESAKSTAKAKVKGAK